ncbi:MAG: S41 family peptidase [Bdellovibrionaceae bacterium]|nr:S41 family peptidase [Bdellovibrionales bacterium]MCB9085290.1 S41 family peptidase [Pseudobdellovibrionaceae bacterium]
MSHRQPAGIKNRKYIRLGAPILVGMGVFLGVLSSASVTTWAKERYSELQLFAKVLNLVQQYYVEEVDTQKLIYGGIKGMLKELDPHTNFLEPNIYKEFESETAGEFGGLGIEITVQDGILTVISPIEDTPAFNAGVKAGDKIVEIDGDSTKGMTLVEAAQHMRGKKGTTVKLGIFRDGFERPKEFAIKRGTVKIRSVKVTDLEDGYVYLKLTSFIENSAKDMKSALKTFSKSNQKINGMVIDLRRNPGGLLEQAVEISDMFLKTGTIVSTKGRNEKEKEVIFAKQSGTMPEFPLVVLVDEYSASASEILAGALQDNKRALIMGQKSFGKGSVQSVVKLGDGSGLKLTVARYYTPSGKSIQAEGITPDVIVDNLSSDILEKAKAGKGRIKREKDIKGHLLGDKERASSKNGKGASKSVIEYWWADTGGSSKKNLSPRDTLLSEDFQVLQAYNYLRAWDVMRQFEGNPTLKK